MPLFRASIFLCLISVASACGRDEKSQRPSGASTGVPALPAPPSRFAATGWPEDAGPVLVMPGSSPQEIRIVLPDLTDKTLSDTSSFELDSLPDAAVTLFSQAHPSVRATVAAGGSEEVVRGCKTWPAARLVSYPGNQWRFGLAENSARDLPLLGWGESLASDSVHAAREVVRIASRSTTDSVFSGIPFAVRFIYRLELGNSRAVVADVIRRINTEANVREQHVLVIAEKPGSSSRYAAAFRETYAGGEDEVRVPELLGSVLLGENRRASLFVSLEHSEGVRLLLIERQRAGSWSLRWRSAYAGC